MNRRSKMLQWIIIFMVGFLIGGFAYLNGAQYFLNQNQEKIYSTFDLLSFLFVNKRFDYYEYLNPNYLFLYFNHFMFVIIGLIIICSPFLLRQKSYLSFLYTRHISFKKANQHLNGFTINRTLAYVFAYFLGIFIFNKCDIIYAFEDLAATQWIGIVVNLILKVCILEVLKQLIFLIYLKKEAAIAFIGGATVVFLLILTDLLMESSFFMLFDESGKAIYMLVPLILMKLGLNWLTYYQVKIDEVLI